MEGSRAKKTIILDFLYKLQGQEITVTMGIGMWNGKITAFDDNSLVLEDVDGISLLKIDEISAIDWAPNWRSWHHNRQYSWLNSFSA